MDKELIEKLAELIAQAVPPEIIISDLEGMGYVIVKKDELIKKAGLIVSEELGIK